MDTSILIDMTIANAEQRGDAIIIETSEGRTFHFDHQQDCCESVYIENVIGDLSSLSGAVVQHVRMDYVDLPDTYGVSTRTTLVLATDKGTVVGIWHGSSNGYYGTGVSFWEPSNDDSRW